MKKLIEMLYSGEIYSAEQIVPSDPEYRLVLHKISDQHNMIKQKLNEEDARQMDILSEQYSRLAEMTECALFAYGVKLGIRLVCEAFQEEHAEFWK